MLGSKNSELTRKYGSRSFASTTLAFAISRWPVANSTQPIAANTSARTTVTASDRRSSFAVHVTSSSSRKSSANGT